MACPHVAGVAALILAHTPGRTTAQVKSAILDNVDSVSKLAGKLITGGRLNAARAIGVPPGPGFSLSVTPPSRLVMRGGATSYAIAIAGTGGFAAPADLSVSGLPAGASASFTSNPATNTSTLVITTTAAALPGAQSFSITGVSGSLYDGTPAEIAIGEPAAAGCSNFLAPTGLLAGHDLGSMATADFNGDGIVDLAVADGGENGVSVLLGEGDGTFGPASRYNTAPNPTSVVAGDFNGDTKIDLAIANFGVNSVSVLLGKGDGTFQIAVAYLAGTHPRSLATADFDHDGDLDLAVANFDSDDVSILYGQGNGTFGLPVSYATASGPAWIITTNLNADSWPDLAVAAQDAGNVSILLGNSNGTFNPAAPLSLSGHPTSLVSGDFNGDGKTDLAVSEGDTGAISIVLGNGNATFQAAVDHPACGTAATSVAVFDAESDGKADLAVTCRGPDQMAFLSGTGTGSFASPLTFSAGFEPAHVVALDVDGDPRKDLVVANSGGSISIYRGFGTCSDPSSVTATATAPTSVGITWTAPAGDPPARYNVYRSSNGIDYALVGFAEHPATSYTDQTAAAGAAYLYKIRSAASDGTNESGDSNRDLAVTVVFTDETLIAGSTPVKAIHLAELRVAVNAVRALAGLPAGTYADPTLTAGVTPIRRVHILDLRSALDAARSALALSPMVYGESLTAAVTPIRKSHVTELRIGVQ